MNRAFLILLIPALLVAAGYIFVLRYMGFAPGYPRLVLVAALFFGAMYWLSKKTAGKADSNRQ
jgi:hypothetical protein